MEEIGAVLLWMPVVEGDLIQAGGRRILKPANMRGPRVHGYDIGVGGGRADAWQGPGLGGWVGRGARGVPPGPAGLEMTQSEGRAPPPARSPESLRSSGEKRRKDKGAMPAAGHAHQKRKNT